MDFCGSSGILYWSISSCKLSASLPSIETTHTSKLNEAERIKTDIDTYIYPSISYSVNFLVHVLIILLHVRFVISNEAIIRKVLLVLICEDFFVLVSESFLTLISIVFLFF